MWNNSFPTVSVTIPYWLVELMDDIYQHHSNNWLTILYFSSMSVIFP